jgi:hypothetical protein
MRPTLIFIRAHYENGSLIHSHGDECPPNLFSQGTINRALDEGYLAECAERRSLYRLFAKFSGCKEREPLSNHERNNLCL